MKELKACPFCGSEAMHTSKPEVEIIECKQCYCKMVYGGSGAALIAMWNTRTNPEVEELTRQRDEAVELLEWIGDGGNLYRHSKIQTKIKRFFSTLPAKEEV